MNEVKEGLEKDVEYITSNNTPLTSSDTGVGGGGGKDGEESTASVVYELYVGGGKGGCSDDDDVIKALEERILNLETLAGSGGGGKNVIKRLDELEEKVGRVDDKKLKDIEVRVKILKGDAEAAGKARKSFKGGIGKEVRTRGNGGTGKGEGTTDKEHWSSPLAVYTTRVNRR